jgi:hypothetical protein
MQELGFAGWELMSSHSAKTTIITFASLAGMSPQDLALLAHHKVPGGSSTTSVYDRTQLLRPTATLAEHIREFAVAHSLNVEDTHHPDLLDISGAKDKTGGLPIELADEPLTEDTALDIESDTEESSSNEDDVQMERLACKSADSRRILNTWRQVLHCGRLMSAGKTSCGKRLRKHYVITEQVPADAEFCKNCFFTRGADNPTSGSESSD